ncbi:hypothetical protein ACOQFB_22625 [Anaeromyxobacter sp. Red801]|uniref:hypothetical protein n=1 Tax=Anaeromyxobacter sp. Red801 TaxID=3411632 RepID=UPI003BA1F12D
MPRPARETSIDAIIRETADRVVERISAAIARQVGELVQDGIQREMAAGRAGRPVRTSRRRVEITRWVADARARRVPNFVIQATGLDTKKKIVARFGENAAFEKGKPLPRARA